MRRLAAMLLAVLAFAQAAAAQTRPDAINMGKLLAYTVNCGCVAGEKDRILEVYRQIFADAYGEAYTNAMQAPLNDALKDGWDRKMSLCERICGLPVTRELQLSLARADGGPVDGSGVSAILGPPPENEPAVVYVSPGTGETTTVPASTGLSEQGAAVPAEEEGRTTFAPQPNYCVYRAYAKGCTPPEEEALVVIAPLEAAEAEAVAAPAGAAVPQEQVTVESQEDDGDAGVAVAVPETLPEVEAQVPQAAPETVAESPETQAEWEADIEAGDGVADYFEEAGTGDNWSSALCRSSPSKPECRKAGGS